ncbi:MAG TPA: tetratricopeptide repeat protein [Anaeromyxobacteraceae bacterium]|nr:tetratricopeptide repeat protein [Anaeromyxobacteraceae bacterium]
MARGSRTAGSAGSSPGSPPPARAGGGAVLAGAGLLAALAFVGSLTELRDFDMFHHLAYGREVLRRGGFAAEDPFLYPLAGLRSGPQPSWLGSVLIYLSSVVAGDAGPLYLAGAAAAALSVVLLLDGLDGDRTPAGVATALVPVSFALAAYHGRAVPRPEMFANVLLALSLLLLRRFTQGRRAFLALFPILLWLWANLHQSVLAGVAVVGIFLVVNAILLPVGRRPPFLPEVADARSLLLPLAATLAGVLLAGLASPVGFAPFQTPLEAVRGWTGLGAPAGASDAPDAAALLRAAVGELQVMPPERWLGPFGWLVALSAASFAIAWRRANLRELVTCAAFVLLAARSVRFGAMAALVLAPVTARNLRTAVAGSRAWDRPARALVAGSLAAGAAVAWAIVAYPTIHFGTGLSRQLPERAARYLRDLDFRGRLFNTFHLGGYLEWTLDRPVFSDGRGAVPSRDVPAALLGPASAGTFAELDRAYRFDALVVEYPEFGPAAYRRLSASAQGADWGADRTTWALVAFDDGGQLYLRRDGVYREAAARDEYRFAAPAVPLSVPIAYPEGARSELERSLRESPGCAICRAQLGYALLALRRPEEAEAVLAGALRGLPATRGAALLGLARAAEARGDRGSAASRLRQAMAMMADPAWPRHELARLAVEDGRAAARAGDPAGALAAFRRASEIDASLPEAHFGLGAALEEQGDAAGAARAYREYLRLAPQGAWARQAAEGVARLR